MVSLYKTLNFFGLEKDAISGTLKDLSKGDEYTSYEIVQGNIESLIRVRIARTEDTDRFKLVEKFENRVRQSLGKYIFSTDERSMENVVGSMLLLKGITISIAESCTGGLVSNMLTNVPGSSQYFLGGVIAYSNQAKQDLLNVNSKTLDEFGAVSDPAAREMAKGVRDVFKSRMGLAITGIAGPDGGSREKPVGTVHIGFSAGNDVFSGKYRFKGSRVDVKQGSAMMALDWVRRYLNEDPFLSGL